MSSLRRGHANLLCIVPILADDLLRDSTRSFFGRTRRAGPRRLHHLFVENEFYIYIQVLGEKMGFESLRAATRNRTRGAMDSASDFESGGCGFESRRVLPPL